MHVTRKRGNIVIVIPEASLAEALTAVEDERGAIASISDLDKFADEVVRELKREEENGDTVLHQAMDAALLAAVENGADGLRYRDD